MNIELDKLDLISMVKGISPPYSAFDHDLVKRSGYYVGGFVDEWRWNDAVLNELTETELYKLYSICKAGETGKHVAEVTNLGEQFKSGHEVAAEFCKNMIEVRESFGDLIISEMHKNIGRKK